MNVARNLKVKYEYKDMTSFVSEYKSFNELLSGGLKYHVPLYQRDFSWTTSKEISMFWEDVCDSIDNKNDPSHFLGYILLMDKGNNTYEIIDGQQRLATLTILFSVIKKKYTELNDVDAITIITPYIIANKDLETRSSTPRLVLNKRNRKFFNDYIQTPVPNLRDLKLVKEYSTNKLIKEAYLFFEDKINEQLLNKSKDSQKDYLNKISTQVSEKFKVIRTIVDSSRDAYRLFMPLNFRGLDLSVADLFKGHLIDATPEVKREEVAQAWDEITNLLDKVGIIDFLRHYWASKMGNVGADKLFEAFQKYLPQYMAIKDDNGVKNDTSTFIKELREEAERYDALANPSAEYWKDKEEIYQLLLDIKTLNMTQCLPLLLSGSKKFTSANDLRKLLETSINFSFRFITIGNQNNKILEGIYSKLAVGLRGERGGLDQIPKINNVDEIKTILLSKYYVDDESFANDFGKKQLKNEKLAKYILAKIENTFTSKPNYTALNSYEKELSIEHILPKSPDAMWKVYLKENGIKEPEEYVYRLGNMTLLKRKKNKDLENRFFDKKTETYRDSPFRITNDLAEIKEWLPKNIEDRQRSLAKIAVGVWKLESPSL